MRKAWTAVVFAGVLGISCNFILHDESHSGKIWIDSRGGQSFSSYLEISSADRKEVRSPESYANIAISQVSDSVNIRREPNTTSSIVGKIYHNCAATILETTDGEGGKWYRIQSGTVSGYIKAQYFITGAQAEAAAKQVGTVYAMVNTASLRLRAEPNLTSETLTMLAQGEEYIVLEENNHFAKLSVDEDLTGYVSMDYIKTRVEFQQAVSVEEEAAKLAEENKRRQDAQEALQKLEEVKLVEAKIDDSENIPGSSTSFSPNGSTFETIAANPLGQGESPQKSAPGISTASAVSPSADLFPINPEETRETAVWMGGNTSSALVTATRTAIIAYAKQFLGNRYVYGGDSLTNGTDCSGFVMRIYEHFGISTGRSSRDQAANGRQIAVEAVQPGDLLFYASGKTINHVAIYIGGGQVIHAASARTGIAISAANYRTPCKAVTFLD